MPTPSSTNTYLYPQQGEIKYLEEEKETNFNVSEIVEGGSLGHGTAVLSKYDIDLVIYSRSKPHSATMDCCNVTG